VPHPGSRAGIALALVVAVTVAVTFARAANGSQPTWASLHRPLQLHRLAPGAPCPVTTTRRLDHDRLRGVGAGPVYPQAASFSRYDRLPAWLGAKVIWMWPAELKTRPVRVLVRGLRIDGDGPFRFQLGPEWDSAPITSELRLVTTRTVGSFSTSNWGTTVTLLLVRTPGCYGLQLDSAGGTSTIVVRAA